MQRIRGKLTYSNVMVTVLALLVLGGGSAYAASQMLPRASVGAKQLKKGAVTPAKLSTASKATLTGPKGSTGATGPQGPKGDTGSQGPSGFTRGFEKSAEERPAASLATSLFSTEVISLAVPSGTYLVTANLQFNAGGTANAAECRLVNGHGGPESEGSDRDVTLPTKSNVNLTMSGLFNVRPGQEMNVECSRDEPTAVQVVDVNINAVQVQEKVVER